MNEIAEKDTLASDKKNELSCAEEIKSELEEVKNDVKDIKELEEKEISFLQASMWRGPLPPPSILEAYEHSFPGLAERIIQMTEKEGNHRREMEKTLVVNISDEKKRGQRFGLIISLFALAISGVAIYYQQAVAASVIGGATVVSLATVFVTGRLTSKKEKQKTLESPEDEE